MVIAAAPQPTAAPVVRLPTVIAIRPLLISAADPTAPAATVSVALNMVIAAVPRSRGKNV